MNMNMNMNNIVDEEEDQHPCFVIWRMEWCGP